MVKYHLPMKESDQTKISKDFRFHKIYDHDTKEFIHPKDVIDDLIKKGKLCRYAKDDE